MGDYGRVKAQSGSLRATNDVTLLSLRTRTSGRHIGQSQAFEGGPNVDFKFSGARLNGPTQFGTLENNVNKFSENIHVKYVVTLHIDYNNKETGNTL